MIRKLKAINKINWSNIKKIRKKSYNYWL